MNEYTASNGIELRVNDEGALERRNPEGTNQWDEVRRVYLRESVVSDALREFFRAERDEELGRWRWNENPQYVVYADSESTVIVVDETTGAANQYARWEAELIHGGVHPLAAAQAFFAAHPEPKPWNRAKEGELWLLRPADAQNMELPYIAVDDTDGQVSMGPRFFRVPEPKSFLPGRFPNEFVEGRRIWPESD